MFHSMPEITIATQHDEDDKDVDDNDDDDKDDDDDRVEEGISLKIFGNVSNLGSGTPMDLWVKLHVRVLSEEFSSFQFSVLSIFGVQTFNSA